MVCAKKEICDARMEKVGAITIVSATRTIGGGVMSVDIRCSGKEEQSGQIGLFFFGVVGS